MSRSRQNGDGAVPDRTIRRLVALVEAITGADIAGHLVGRVPPHLDRQLEALGLKSPDAYLRALGAAGEEPVEPAGLDRDLLDALLATLLVHETFFYRFASQLEALETQVLPPLLQGQSGAPLRLWSAGCSRGPEPYTLAMIACQAVRSEGLTTKIEVLGTDLCGEFIETARRGVFREAKLGDLPPHLRDRYLERNPDETYTIGDVLRRIVRFERHNLLHRPPAFGFDVIACRNVLIYLRPEARRAALDNLASALAPGGVLLTGHSESLRDVPDLFVPHRRLALGIYRRATGRDRSRAIPRLAGPIVSPAPRPPEIAPPKEVDVTPPNDVDVDVDVDVAPPKEVDAVPPQVLERKIATSLRSEVLELEGDYDQDRSPERLDQLKDRLGRAIEAGGDLTIEADGATCLDGAAARLIARAARAIKARGGRLSLVATRPPVKRWAERNRLPFSETNDSEEVRRP